MPVPVAGPVPENDRYQQRVLDNYDTVLTPIGYPVFPGFPQRPPHDGDGA